MNDPKKLHLQPLCKNPDCGYPEPDERSWCEDDVWHGDDCEYCNQELPEATAYVIEVPK